MIFPFSKLFQSEINSSQPTNQGSRDEQTVVDSSAVNVQGILSGQKVRGSLEFYSPTWVWLEDHIEQKIKKLRSQNDNQKLTIEKTQALRGRIFELKQILSLKDPKPITAATDRTQDHSHWPL